MPLPRFSVTAIVPSVGRSPWLEPCLEALRRQPVAGLELILVAQGDRATGAASSLSHRTLHLERPAGFARAVNAGLAAARGELVCTVNDDAIVSEGWLPPLLEALAADPEAACAQGTNLSLSDSARTDGCGLAWNGAWQAVQLGHGRPPPAPDAAAREVFGVSATAAVYRRAALERVASGDDGPFDEQLYAYYEDVELACALRSRGLKALSVPAARASHAGGASAAGLAGGATRLVYGNRLLVLARLLGRALPRRLPRVLSRDGADLCRALLARDGRQARGILMGWRRAAGLWRRYSHAGPPRVALDELRRLGASTWRSEG